MYCRWMMLWCTILDVSRSMISGYSRTLRFPAVWHVDWAPPSRSRPSKFDRPGSGGHEAITLRRIDDRGDLARIRTIEFPYLVG